MGYFHKGCVSCCQNTCSINGVNVVLTLCRRLRAVHKTNQYYGGCVCVERSGKLVLEFGDMMGDWPNRYMGGELSKMVIDGRLAPQTGGDGTLKPVPYILICVLWTEISG